MDHESSKPRSINDFHKHSDLDSSRLAQHHTLGTKRHQASPGNHTHDGTNSLKLRTVSSTSTTTSQTGLTVETVVLSQSHEFKPDRAYRIHYTMRVQLNGGTSPFGARVRLRRSTASGTVIYDPGITVVLTTNFVPIHGWIDIKRTGTSSTTQTIALTIERGATGSPTSIDVESAATAPALLRIEELGPSADYSGAIEVPTS